MIQENEVREQIARVRAGALSIAGLRSWLNARGLNMHLDSSLAAQQLVGMIGLLLAEHLLGDRTDEDVLDMLRRMAETVEISVDFLPLGVERVNLRPASTSTSPVLSRRREPAIA